MKIDIDLTTKVLGAIGGLYVVVKETAKALGAVKKWKNTRSARQATFLAGNWNNQGQISNVPSHYIDLDSWASGHKFTRCFNVRLGHDINSWTMFHILEKNN